MVEYTCLKCNKIFIKKSNYDSHINRKRDCLKSTKITPINTDDNISTTEITPINTNNNILSLEIVSSCNYCKKYFSRVDALTRHLKDRCKVKKDMDIEKELILEKLINQNKILMDEVTNLKKKMKK